MSYHRYPGLAADRRPHDVGLRFEGQAWTYAELADAVSAATHRLAAQGVGSGTRVLLLLENRPEYVIAQFALAALGAVFVTPNPYWTDAELAHAVAASGAQAAIHEPRLDRFASTLAMAIPVAALSGPVTGPTARIQVSTPDADLYIPFSSGTTGLPKGVVHTHGSLSGAVDQLSTHLALTDRDVLQVALPLCHVFGTTIVAAAIGAGAEVTLFRRFDLDAALRHITEDAVTVWPLAGTVAHQLAARENLQRSAFASLRFFMWGGSTAPAALADDITKRTGVPFLTSYGMTEAIMVAFNPVDRPPEWRLDSPGFATTGTELRLRADGELEVRGPSVARGYANHADEAFGADGFFRTGDRAGVAADGRVTIVDRIKDLVKVSGFQVSPAEVEQVLMAHPGVADAAVVGTADDRTGEAPLAFVVPGPCPPTPAELRGWAAARLATYKLPRHYRFVPTLPRTAGGKLRRIELRAAAWSDLGGTHVDRDLGAGDGAGEIAGQP